MIKKKLPFVIALLLLIALALSGTQLKMQYRKVWDILSGAEPQSVTMFRIYPKVYRPTKEFIDFDASDILVKEFFRSLTDIHSYNPSHESVVSWEQTWFMEMLINENLIQVSFLIPFRNKHIVIGHLGRFNETSVISYGHFQSRQLYQWYQTYSHRWLTPEGTPPAPQP